VKLRNAACIALLLASHGLSVAQVAAPPVADRSLPTRTTLEDLDRLIAVLKLSHWELPRTMGNPPPDATGRRPQDDLEEYVLTEVNLRRITTARQELETRGASGSLVISESEPLALLVQAEACRMMTVTSYWSIRKAREFHQDLIQRLIARLPEVDRPSASGGVATIEADDGRLRPLLVEGIKACGNPQPGLVNPANTNLPGWLGDIDAQLEAYNEQRQKLAAKLDAVMRAATPEGNAVRRSIACPPPAAATNTPATRRLSIRTQPDLRDYFPREAINYKVTGNAKLRMTYDDTGCITSIAILESTGADILDAAAIRIGFDYALLPPQEDGKPIEGGVILPVNFSIRDVSMIPGYTAQPQP
jgi:TonB family protein